MATWCTGGRDGTPQLGKGTQSLGSKKEKKDVCPYVQQIAYPWTMASWWYLWRLCVMLLRKKKKNHGDQAVMVRRQDGTSSFEQLR